MRAFALFGAITLSLSLASASAGLLDGKQENPFLPVDEAFRIQPGEIDGNMLSMRWDVAEGYYLYRHRFEFSALDPAGLGLGEVELPPGLEKHDEYFGDIQAYYDSVTARIPVQGDLPDHITLSVHYQGCADKGLCYPPQIREVRFERAGVTSKTAATKAPGEASQRQPEQDRLAGLIGDGDWLSILGQFYLLGLLLAFTPCVLPMIPILSGVIVGLDQQRSAMFAFLLSLAYVLAMALAYALFGAIAGVFGHNLQAAMQAPVVLIAFSGLFVALALSMFGLYRLQMPATLQSRLSEISAKQKGGTLIGAAIMGFLSALIVGPCVAPPLAGALLYIGQTGDPMRGGMALFTMGLGMGTPLLALGTLEGRLLPRTGAWMNRVNHLFGFLLLGVAVWLLARITPPLFIMLLWGTLTLGLGIYLGALSRAERSGWQQLEQTLGLLALVYGILILVGASLGGQDPLRPLAQSLQTPAGSNVRADSIHFERIKSLNDLQAQLDQARADGQPAMLDFYADWCVACKEYEHKIFPDPQVRPLMQQMRLIQADVTANDAIDRKLMRELGVIGPPTMIFYHANGTEHAASRLIGELNSGAFAAHLRQFLQSAQP